MATSKDWMAFRNLTTVAESLGFSITVTAECIHLIRQDDVDAIFETTSEAMAYLQGWEARKDLVGECTRETPTVFSSWWCHACDKSVPWQEVQEGGTHLTPEEAREILSAFVPDPPV